MPLARNAVTFNFCQTARSDRTAIAIFVSKRMCPASRADLTGVLNAGARPRNPAREWTGVALARSFVSAPEPSPGRSLPGSGSKERVDSTGRAVMPRITRYAIREAEGAPGPAAAVRAQPWSRPRLRGYYQAARPQRRRLRTARGHRLPGAAPAGRGRLACQRLEHRVRAPPPYLPAHPGRRDSARRAVAAVERVQR